VVPCESHEQNFAVLHSVVLYTEICVTTLQLYEQVIHLIFMDHSAVETFVSQVASHTNCNAEAGVNRQNYLFMTLLVVTHA
jgi:hypothetical protein